MKPKKRWITDPTDLKRNRVVDPCLFARAAAPDVELDDMITVAKWVAWVSPEIIMFSLSVEFIVQTDRTDHMG